MVSLAIDGGEPVRREPLPHSYPGASVLGDEELALLKEVIEAQSPFREYGVSTPHMVRDFEREARDYLGVPYALATATGSGAFYCAMAGLGLGPGDEVIIPCFSWYTCFMAPVLLGATPVFADIDRSLGMDPADLERKITPATRAVLVVHYQGATTDMERILAISRAHSLRVVEDCAQAFGVAYRGRLAGSLGDVAGFSLQQNKITCTGDGGLLATHDPLVFERAARYHDLGLIRPSLAAQLDGGPQEPQFCGLQVRMNELTGAVALAQLRKVERAVLSVTRGYHRLLKGRLSDTCEGMAFRATGDDEGDAGTALFVDLGTPERAAWFNRAVTAEGIRMGPPSACRNLLHTDVVAKRVQAHPALPPFGPGQPGEVVRYTPDLCPNTDGIIASMACVALGPAFQPQDVEDIGTAIIKVWHNRPAELFE
jgi:dTDP-4-amino-4,6-dideoxygalactose transaminase